MKTKFIIRWALFLVILVGMNSACNLPVAGPSPEEVQAAANALTSQDPSQANETDIQTALDLAAEAQKLGMDQTAQDLLDWAREALTSMAAGLMRKKPCEATLEDVRQAIELAGEAQKVPGMEATADQLMDWARAAFQSYTASRAASGADAQERTQLAVTAQQLGLDQLAEDLMAGNPISNPCPETWQGSMEGQYRSTLVYDPYTCPHTDSHTFEFTYSMDFQFTVSTDGYIQGNGTGEINQFEETWSSHNTLPTDPIACMFDEGYCCIEPPPPPNCYLVDPEFDVEITGRETDGTFHLYFDGGIFSYTCSGSEDVSNRSALSALRNALGYPGQFITAIDEPLALDIKAEDGASVELQSEQEWPVGGSVFNDFGRVEVIIYRQNR